jgi:hypothetical protein
VKTGLAVADQVQSVAAEAYERTQYLVAEARHEYEQENGRRAPSVVTGPTTETTSRRRRSSGPADPGA